MSWYLFREAPAVQNRGIKVDGFQNMHRNRLNLSWGINESQPSDLNQYLERDVLPSTIVLPTPKQNRQIDNNIKVLTENSEDDQEELMKLIKTHNEKKLQQQIIEKHSHMKQKSYSINSIDNQNIKIYNRSEKNRNNSQFDKRMRYLQNSLLPICKRDSMDTILDHQLGKQIPLGQSRVSNKSFLHNKKNDSNVPMGNGYNAFTAAQEPKKELTQQLREMYQYEDNYKRRVQNSGFKFG